MEQLNAEDLYSRSRELFVDLLKLGLSLSTGVVAALSVFVFNSKNEPFNTSQVRWHKGSLILLLVSIALALIGWLAQAMFYSAWALDMSDNGNRKNKWRIIRNWSLWLFALLFLLGVIASAVFVNSFIKAR